MISTMMYVLTTFCAFSILGWVLEVCYRSAHARRFVNPGLLMGPYLILYGAGALTLVASGWLLAGSGVIVKALVYVVMLTGLELGSGFLAEHLFHIRLWDYSDQRFNIRGHICPRFTAYWVAAAFVFEYLVYPAYRGLLRDVPAEMVTALTGVVAVVMAADFTVVVGRRLIALPQRPEVLKKRFDDIARPLLETPEVARLSDYPHHLAKTRLQHVTEVAWLAYLWGSRLSLAGSAIVRGALLHDLFYYDWLTGGPRLHGFRHPLIALANAREITGLTKKEEDIIMKHMWPLTVAPPLYMESLIVSIADTVCAARDYLSLKDLAAARSAYPARPGLEPQRVMRYADTVRRRIGTAFRR